MTTAVATPVCIQHTVPSQVAQAGAATGKVRTVSFQAPPGYRMIARKFLSNNVFPPHSNTRNTLPTKGIQEVNACVKEKWGESIAKNMGTIKVGEEFNPDNVALLKDHKHFIGAYIKYLQEKHNIKQVDEKLIWKDKTHDDIAPPVFKEYFDVTKLKLSDGIPVNPYYSHTSVFEVFPKPTAKPIPQCDDNVKAPSTTEKVLEAYAKELYSPPDYKQPRTVQHQKCLYPPPVHPPLDPEDARLVRQDYLDLCQTHTYMPAVLRAVLMSKDAAPHSSPLLQMLVHFTENKANNASRDLVEAIEALCAFATSSTASKLRCRLLNDYPVHKFTLVLGSQTPVDFKARSIRRIMRSFMEELVQSQLKVKAVTEQASLANIVNSIVTPQPPKRPKSSRCRPRNASKWPIWPPSRSHVYDCRLLKFRSNQPTKDQDPYPNAVNEQKTFVYQVTDPYEYKAPGQCVNRSCHALNRCWDCTREERGERMPDDGAPTTGGAKEGRKFHHAPPPTSHKSGYSQNMRFQRDRDYRSHAQKGFHDQYTDEVPDLRDNHKTGKRQWFNGTFAYTLRGLSEGATAADRC